MFLNQPYPVSEKSPLQIVLVGLACGAFVAAFLIVFQPFGTDRVNFPNKNLFLAGYGIISAATICLIHFLSGYFFTADRWTVGRQIIMVTGGVLLGITLCYFYILLLGYSPSWEGYGYFVVNAMKVAVFPIVGITMVDYVLKLKRYSQGAEDFNARYGGGQSDMVTPVPSESAATLKVFDDQDRVVITVPLADLWCIRSDRNYVDVVHLDGAAQPRKTTVRNTLTKVSSGLPEAFIRSHRSYLVNARLVDSVTGNAQGYRLHNERFTDFPVPVSRGKSTEILRAIR